MVGSYKHPGFGMGRGEGYRPQMVLEIMQDSGDPMTSEQIRNKTNCTDRRHFGSLLSRMWKDGMVCRSGLPPKFRGADNRLGAYRYRVTPRGSLFLQKYGATDVGVDDRQHRS